MSKQERKTNLSLVALIGELKDHSRSTGSSIWRDTASRLESSRKNWAEPNLSHISRHSQEKETVLVPGKKLTESRPSPHSASATRPRTKLLLRVVEHSASENLWKKTQKERG